MVLNRDHNKKKSKRPGLFRPLTIKGKLLTIVMSVTVTAVLLVGTLTMIFQVIEFREHMVDDLAVHVEMIANNCRPSVIFDDPGDAKRILASLQSKPAIAYATVFRKDGTVFADYRRSGFNDAPPRSSVLSGYQFEGSWLKGSQNLFLQDELMGSVYLQSDLSKMWQWIKISVVVFGLSIFISMILAYFLSAGLQRVISKPIDALANTASDVKKKGDYSVRVAKESEDELGILTDAFNNMLSRIEERDTDNKRFARSLQESEARFRNYFEIGLIGMALTSPEKGWIQVNDRLCEIFGYPEEELIQKTWTDLTHPDDLKTDIEQFNRVMAGETDGYSLDKRFIRNDGNIIYASISVKCLRNDDGSVDQFVAFIQDITDRKKAEKEVLIFKSFVEASHQGMGIGSFDGKIQYVNKALAQIVGEDSFEALVGNTLFNYYSEENQQKFQTEIIPAIMAGGQWSGELEIVTAKGISVPTHDSYHVVHNDEGNPQFLAALIMDISERKAAEMELKRLKSLIDNTNDFISTSDLEGNILYTNPMGMQLTGNSEKNPRAMHITDYHAPGISEKILSEYLPIVREKGIWAGEIEVLHSDKSSIPVNGVIMMINDDGGIPIGYGAIYRDIRVQKKFEQDLENLVEKRTRQLRDIHKKLKISEERFALAMEGANAGLWDWDLKTNQVYLSPLWKSMLGYADSELENSFETWETLTHPEDIDEAKKIIESYLHSKTESYMLYFRMKHKSGHYVHILSRGFGISDGSGGEYARLIGTHVDVSDLKQAEANIRELNRTLEQRVEERTAQLAAVNRELESFSYSVSHDLRAPLRAINGFSNILKEDYSSALDEDGNRVLSVITGNVKKMGQLIDDLLAFSRLDRQTINPEPIDISEIAAETMEQILQGSEKKKPDLKMNDLPNAFVDAKLIKVVMTNLLSNAIKYQKNEETPVIEVGGHRNNNHNVYFVKDNGVGFDMQYTDKLFGVFQRLHSSKEYEGTGIGLSIVKRIITRHGGRVWAEAAVNEGATFYFTLPIKETDHEPSRNITG